MKKITKILAMLLVAVSILNIFPVQNVSAQLKDKQMSKNNSYHFKKGEEYIHLNVGEDYVVTVINNKTGKRTYGQIGERMALFDPVIKFYTPWNDLGITDMRQELTKEQKKQISTITGVKEGYTRITIMGCEANVLVGNGILPEDAYGEVGDKYYIKYYGDEGDEVISYKVYKGDRDKVKVSKKGKVTLLKETGFMASIYVKVRKANGKVVKYTHLVSVKPVGTYPDRDF